MSANNISQPYPTEFDYQLTAAQAYAGNVALHNREFLLFPKMISEDFQRYVMHIHRDKQGRVQVYGKTANSSSEDDIKLAKEELKIMIATKVKQTPDTTPIESVSSTVDMIDDLLEDMNCPFIKVQILEDKDDYGTYHPCHWSPSDLVALLKVMKSSTFDRQRPSLETLIYTTLTSYQELFECRKIGTILRKYRLAQGLKITFQNLQANAGGEVVGLKATVEVMLFVLQFERDRHLTDGRGVALSVVQSAIL